MEIFAFVFYLNFQKGRKGKNKHREKTYCKFVFTFSPFNYQVRSITRTKTLPNASTANRIMPEHSMSTRSQKVTACASYLRHQHQNYFHQNPGS